MNIVSSKLSLQSSASVTHNGHFFVNSEVGNSMASLEFYYGSHQLQTISSFINATNGYFPHYTWLTQFIIFNRLVGVYNGAFLRISSALYAHKIITSSSTLLIQSEEIILSSSVTDIHTDIPHLLNYLEVSGSFANATISSPGFVKMMEIRAENESVLRLHCSIALKILSLSKV